MNRLPQKKKRGDPVLAEDWNTLLDAISARTPRPGTGLELIASSGGFAYSQPSGALVPRQSLPPFSVIGIEKDESGLQVIVKEGWLIERKPKSGDTPAVRFHSPKAGGVTLDTVPRPKIAMNTGDTLWCKYQTDAKGEITGEPEILAAADDQDGSHYYPEDPDGSGQEGTYFVKLFKLEDDGGTPKVKVYQQSDIEHWAQLWTGENVGGGKRVFKEHAEDENLYRFRTIDRRAEDHQIDVVEEDETIRIHGNEKNGSLTVEGETAPVLEWRDGLVTTEGDGTIPDSGPEGLTCDVIFNDCDPDESSGDNFGAELLRLSFENGVLVGVNESTTARPLSGNVFRTLVQSCHWIDDPDL